MSRVMVVDDEPDMRLAVRLILERQGHTVEEVSGGEEACRRVQSAPPDLLLMDVRMPGQDGLETLVKIRETNPSLPIIIMTGYGNPETEREAFRKGASRFLLKPFRNEELLEAMSQVGLKAGKAKPAADPIASERRSRQSTVLQHCVLSLQRFWYILRQAWAICLDRWHNPPILFERDPSLEERISLRLSVITDPVKVIFHGLFDKDFESMIDDPEQDMPPAEQPQDNFQGVRTPEPESLPAAAYPRVSAPAEPVDRPPDVERVHQDLSEQIQSVAHSLQAEIGRLAEQMHQRQDSPKAIFEPVAVPQAARETPQAEFHRLLIELQTTWDQGLSAAEEELSAEQGILREWSKTLPGLRQAVDRSKAA